MKKKLFVMLYYVCAFLLCSTCDIQSSEGNVGGHYADPAINVTSSVYTQPVQQSASLGPQTRLASASPYYNVSQEFSGDNQSSIDMQQSQQAIGSQQFASVTASPDYFVQNESSTLLQNQVRENNSNQNDDSSDQDSEDSQEDYWQGYRTDEDIFLDKANHAIATNDYKILVEALIELSHNSDSYQNYLYQLYELTILNNDYEVLEKLSKEIMIDDLSDQQIYNLVNTALQKKDERAMKSLIPELRSRNLIPVRVSDEDWLRQILS